MVKRVSKKRVTFQFAFSIEDIGKQLPAGEYTIATEEESIVGSSFLTYQHIATFLEQGLPNGRADLPQYWCVDREALAHAIEADADRFLASNRAPSSANTPSNQKPESE